MRAKFSLSVRNRQALWAVLATGLLITATLSGAFRTAPGYAQLDMPLQFHSIQAFEVAAGDEPVSQAFALFDVDDDGELDLIVVNQDEDGIDIMMGVGDGTFEEPELIDTEEGTPAAVVVADVSSPFASDAQGAPDDIPDLIVGYDDGNVQIFPGDGDGGFEAGQEFSDFLDASIVTSLVVADFEEATGGQDRALDLAVLDSDSDEVYFICNDNGNFAPCDTPLVETDGDTAIKMLGGEFNGDGNADVVVLNQGSVDITLIGGNGNGTFRGILKFPGGAEGEGEPIDFVSDDLNGDSIDDIVLITDEEFSDQTAAILLMQRGGNDPQRSTFGADPQASSMVLLNVDGSVNMALDLVIANPGFLAGLVGNGDGTFTDVGGIGVSGGLLQARVIQGADLGFDELPDLIVLSDDGTRMQVAINDTAIGGPTFTPGTPPTSTVTRTGSPGPTNTPTATVPTPTITLTPTPTAIPTVKYGRCDVRLGGNLTGVATGQLDADGTLDIAVTDATNNSVLVIFNSNNLRTAVHDCAELREKTPTPIPLSPTPLRIAVGSAPRAIVAVDLDRDADMDLAVAGSDGITVLRNDGSGGFTAETPIAVGNSPQAIVADYPDNPMRPEDRTRLDLDGDGFTDLVVADGSGLSILYGNAAGGLVRRLPDPNVGGAATSVVAAKFDANSSIDLAVVVGGDAFHLLQGTPDNTGRPQFAVRGLVSGDPVRALATGFFNDDLRPDILVAQPGRSRLFVYAGGISFSAAGTFASGTSPTAAGVGVLDAANLFNDRDADAVVAGEGILSFGIGDGTGSFATMPEPFAVGASPQAVSVVDIDGTGVQDVITANSNGTLSFLLSSVPPLTPTPTVTGTATQSGTPTGTPPPPASETPTPTSTLRRSQTPTRTATATQTKAGVFALNGTGCSVDETPARFPVEAVAGVVLFALARTIRRRRAVAVGRNNRNATLLLLASLGLWHAQPASAQLLRYTSCEIPRDVLASGSSGSLVGVVPGFFNGDITPDLVLLYEDRLGIELSNSDQFAGGHCLEAVTASSLAIQGAVSVAVGLIDGDQDADLAVATATNVVLLLGDGAGAFTDAGQSLPTFLRPTSIATADLNEDGRGDLVVGDDTEIKILLGRAEPGYVVTNTLDLDSDTDSPVLAVRLADFDGDQDLDIAAADNLGTVGVFLQATDGSFPMTPSRVASVAVPRDLQVDDLGGTADPDVALTTTGGKVEVLLTTATGFTPGAGISLGSNVDVRSLALGALDNDNNVDAVAADRSNGRLYVLLGDGAGAFEQSGDPLPTGNAPRGVALADLDNDGAPDIVTSNSGDGSITVFLSSNPEATVTSTPTLVPTTTLTPTRTLTPTLTGTPASTGTVTETPTITPIGTATRTATATETTTPGAFEIQGEGCANMGGSRGAADAMPLLVLGALALIRRRARSRA